MNCNRGTALERPGELFFFFFFFFFFCIPGSRVRISPVLADLISHTFIRPVGKTKIENFHMFDIHLLYRTSRYAIVKVDVTERYDVTKRHSIVITIRRRSAIEATAFSKTYFQKLKVCKKKNLSWVWRTDRNIRPSESQSDITRQPSWFQKVTLGTGFLSTPYTHERFSYSRSSLTLISWSSSWH